MQTNDCCVRVPPEDIGHAEVLEGDVFWGFCRGGEMLGQLHHKCLSWGERLEGSFKRGGEKLF